MMRIRRKIDRRRMKFLAFALTFCFLGALMGGAKTSHALLIIDDMIFVGQKSGSATFKVKNTGQKPLAYRIEWTQKRMAPGGKKEKIMPDELIENVNAAEPFMFLAPRRMILQSGQLQHIRFMVRRMENLAPGEYRSYIALQPEKIPQEYATGGEVGSTGNLATAQVDFLTGYNIPVFFLHGETTLKTEITQASLGQGKQGRNGVHFTFKREGNRSAIGELMLTCVGTEGSKLLSKVKIKIFTEITERSYFTPFEWPPGGCHSVTFDYSPHKLDPDYALNAVRMMELPVN